MQRPSPACVYLDHAATSPCPPHLLQGFVRYQNEVPWNSETVYEAGLQTKQRLEEARQEMASLLGIRKDQLIFTSGGTEGNNFAAHVLTQQKTPGVLWVSKTVHPSQGEHHVRLATLGWNLVELPTLASGAIDLNGLEQLPAPQLISVEWVNSEVGLIQNIDALIAIKNRHKALLWVDGVQGLGKCPLPRLSEVDAFVFSGHKLGTPVGVGGIILGSHLKKAPYLLGGGQENGWRSGTVAVPLILTLRDALQQSLSAPQAQALNCCAELLSYRRPEQNYSPYIYMLNVAPVDGEILLHQLAAEGIMVGLGSACRASRKKISAVHKAMGLNEQQSRQTLRISFNFRSSAEDLTWALERIESLWKASQRFYR